MSKLFKRLHSLRLPVYCVLFSTKQEHLKMTLSSIEGTLKPPASHETCLFIGSFFNFHADSRKLCHMSF